MENIHKIQAVENGSIAQEVGIEPGDSLLCINDKEIADVFDYQFQVQNEELVLLIQKEDGEQWEIEIEKEADEDLGIQFSEGLMDAYRSCRNRCMFCFIDQLPKGMRETLYFKDDDSRLSFLQGNYITLTNMTDEDVQRIVKYHLGPINISFQAMDSEVRCKMLHNRFAGEALSKVDILYNGGITMNGQIVLCKGVNDGEILEDSISKLYQYLPLLQSVSIVPVGLTKYREGLYPLESFEKEDAKEVLQMIHKWQKKAYEKYGTHFVHAGDEWYLLAEEEIPLEASYDGYLQLENGVGMMRLLLDEFEEALSRREPDERVHYISVATGVSAYPFISELTRKMKSKFPNIEVNVYCLKNEFFGEKITVVGLLTGQDVVTQLKGKSLGEYLVISRTMLKADEDIFLDDKTLLDVENELHTKIRAIGSSGEELLSALLNDKGI